MPDIRITDFTGGETDRFRDADPRFCQKAKNFVYNENGDLITRPGFAAIDATEPDPLSGIPITKIWHHRTRKSTESTPGEKRHRLETFIAGNGTVRRFSRYETSPGRWNTVTIPASNTATNAAHFSSSSQGNYIRLNDNEFVLIADGASNTLQRPLKFYREDETGEWKYISLGLPRLDDDVVISVTDGGGAAQNRLLAFVLKHTYTLFEPGVGEITKIVRGAPRFYDPGSKGVLNVDVPVFDSTTLTDWVDGDGENVDPRTYYDFGSSVKPPEVTATYETEIEIYVTENNGSIFYFYGNYPPFGAIPLAYPDGNGNGVDRVVSLLATPTGNEQLYTTGGVVGNDMINERIKYGTFANDALWLASTSRVWQSKVGIYDAMPGSFQFNVREGEFITGINTIDIYPIVFTNLGVYRIEGIVDDLGRGAHRVRTVSEDYGAFSNKTIVKARNKLFFWSEDGFYETNGYQAVKVTGHYDESFKLFNGISLNDANNGGGDDTWNYYIAEGTYDEVNERLTWMYPDGESITLPIVGSPTADDRWLRNMITLNLKYRHEEGYAITSGRTECYARTISASLGDIYMGTHFGAALKQYDDVYTDTDFLGVAGQATLMIKWQYISSSLSFGSSLIRKWFTRLLMNFKKNTDIDARVFSTSDEENDDWREHVSISRTKTNEGQWYIKRWFKRGQIRGTYKTVRIEDNDVQGQKVQLSDLTVVFAPSGEGHTEDVRA